MAQAYRARGRRLDRTEPKALIAAKSSEAQALSQQHRGAIETRARTIDLQQFLQSINGGRARPASREEVERFEQRVVPYRLAL